MVSKPLISICDVPLVILHLFFDGRLCMLSRSPGGLPVASSVMRKVMPDSPSSMQPKRGYTASEEYAKMLPKWVIRYEKASLSRYQIPKIKIIRQSRSMVRFT